MENEDKKQDFSYDNDMVSKENEKNEDLTGDSVVEELTITTNPSDINSSKKGRKGWGIWFLFFFLLIIVILGAFKIWDLFAERGKPLQLESPPPLDQEEQDEGVIKTTTDVSEIPKFKELYSGIRIPTYVPDGYKFESFLIRETDRFVHILYDYVNEDQDYLTIILRDTYSPPTNYTFSHEGYAEKVEGGTMYFFRDNLDERNLLTFYSDDMSISFSVSTPIEMDKEVLEAILDGFQPL